MAPEQLSTTKESTGSEGAGIQAVVFDIGGVLLDWDPRYLYRQLIDDPAELDDFLDRICTREWHRAHDLGVDTEQSCRELASSHPEHAELIMAWSRRGEEMIGGAIEETVAGAERAARPPACRCFALSNMEPDKFELRRARFGFFELLDGCVISGLEGVVKPDRKIFECCWPGTIWTRPETVFIDDQPANVAGSQGTGRGRD